MPPRVKSPVPIKHHMHAWRKAKGLTLQQVADAIGSTKGHLSNIESGNREMTPAVAEAIAKALGISAETLRARLPGEAIDLEQDLLALFRGGDVVQRRAILEMARTIRAMGPREARTPDHDATPDEVDG